MKYIVKYRHLQHYSNYLCLFAYSGVQYHVVLFLFVLLPVSLYCLFLIAPSVLSMFISYNIELLFLCAKVSICVILVVQKRAHGITHLQMLISTPSHQKTYTNVTGEIIVNVISQSSLRYLINDEINQLQRNMHTMHFWCNFNILDINLT